MVSVLTNGLWEQGSIPKTQKMVLDAYLLNTQNYKVWIKSKWINPGKGVMPSLHLCVIAIEKEAFGSLLTTINQLTNLYMYIQKWTDVYSPLYGCFITFSFL